MFRLRFRFAEVLGSNSTRKEREVHGRSSPVEIRNVLPVACRPQVLRHLILFGDLDLRARDVQVRRAISVNSTASILQVA